MNETEKIILSLNETKCDPISRADSLTARILMTLGFSVLLIFALVGNCLVIAVFCKRKDQLCTTVNCFIINMAVSDLLVPILVIPRRIQEVYLGWSPWLMGGGLGDFFCRLLNFADEVSVTVSSQSMVFIAAERFWSIVFPMKSPLISKRATPRYICFTWIFSSIFFSYYFFAHRLDHNRNKLVCRYGIPEFFNTWKDLWRVDRMTFLAVFVVFPFLLLTVFYTMIIVTLYRQEKSVIHLSSDVQRKRAKENQRITLMLLTVVILFFVSWTPYYVYIFLRYYLFGSSWSCSAIQKWYLGSIYINYAYTAINPIIYYTFNRAFRLGMQEMLFCRQRNFFPCCHPARVGFLQTDSIKQTANSVTNGHPKAKTECFVLANIN